MDAFPLSLYPVSARLQEFAAPVAASWDYIQEVLASMNARWMIALLTLMAGALAPPSIPAQQPARPQPKVYDEIVAALPRTDASGVVVDKDGAPVAGADVFLYYERHDEGLRNRLAGRVKTDAEGKFRFTKAVVWEPIVENRAPRYKMKYDVIARHPGRGAGFAVFTKTDPADNLKVALEKTKSFDITVQDAAGKPVEGARVWVSALTRRNRPAGLLYEYAFCRIDKEDIGLASGKTDRDGKVKLDAPESAAFIAEKDGFVQRTGGEKIYLMPSASVSGRVLTPEGKPLPGAVVWYSYIGSNLSDRWVTEADKEGRFVFKNVPAKGFRYSSMSAKDEDGSQAESSLVAEDLTRGSRIIGMADKFQLNPGEKVTRDLKMVRAAVLAGQVVNEKTGKPAPNIAMLRSELDRSNYLKNFTTNAQGRFRFLYPAGMEVSLYFDTPRDGSYIMDQEQARRQVWRQTLTADKTDLVFKAKLWDTGPLEGVVIDFDRKPSKFQHSIYFHSDIPAVKNGPDGRFTLKVAPRDRDFDLFVIGPSKIGGQLVHCKAGTTSVTLRTERFRDYAGVVTTPDGTPAGHLKFYLDLKLNGTTIYQVRQEPETDAKGMFVVKGLLPKATYEAWWSADNEKNRDYDYGNVTIDLSKQKPDEPITFQAKQYLNALMGKVVDGAGKPVAGAQIAVENGEMQPQDARFNKRYTSDKKGAFTIERLAAGKVKLKVNHPDFKSRSIETDSDAIDCAVQLSPRGDEIMAKVQVIDEKGNPVPAAPVTAVCSVLNMLIGEVTTQTQAVQIDAQGRGEFRMKVDRKDVRQRFSGAIFCCDKPGYDLAFAYLQQDEDADLVLRMRPSKDHWSGQILDENGKPLAGAKVFLSGLRYDKAGSFTSLREGTPGCSVITGKDGRFEFPRISRDCGLSLSVSAPGYARLNEWVDSERMPQPVFTLTRSGTIQGKVVIRETGKPFTEGQIFVQSPENGGGQVVRVGQDGAFTIDGLKTGEYKLILTQGSETPLSHVPVAYPSVAVEVGKKVAVTLEVQEGVLVKGKVVNPATGKAPEGKGFVAARAKDNPFAGSGVLLQPDGLWQFRLAPGVYELGYGVIGQNGGSEPTVKQPLTIEKGKKYEEIVLEAK